MTQTTTKPNEVAYEFAKHVNDVIVTVKPKEVKQLVRFSVRDVKIAISLEE